MVTPLDPTALGFLLAENRRMPMHVGGLQLYRKPEGAGRDYVRTLFEQLRDQDDVAPLFRKRPFRSVRTAGQYVWVDDDQFDIEYHVRHSALPKPGRVRELLELVSRLHSTRMARERPLWEWHIIEGLRDGRVAMYAKLHHSLVDGVSANRLLQSVLAQSDAIRRQDVEAHERPNLVGGQVEVSVVHDALQEVVATTLFLQAVSGLVRQHAQPLRCRQRHLP